MNDEPEVYVNIRTCINMDSNQKSRSGVFSLFIAVILVKHTLADVLQCYKCSVSIEKYVVDNKTMTTPLCSKFQESSNYMVQCPYSTMCLKSISILHLQNGQEKEAITRGCAQQKNTTQIFRNKQWEQEHLVQEVYDEGCRPIINDLSGGSIKRHCYCRGNLCNTAGSFNTKSNVLLTLFFVCSIYQKF
ncbi:uncharacterized protein LOC123037318 [Drosophila rhopaloa]|uniref:Protein sleepless n=1 Tax=Drosophila rhopaloa TaxID=1041015 RepID=A0ABM5J3H4_DRORH|nr:uncharacterized protein LOC123037318 [Drosophila rhopaloa]